jgi:hypothetical protein
MKQSKKTAASFSKEQTELTRQAEMLAATIFLPLIFSSVTLIHGFFLYSKHAGSVYRHLLALPITFAASYYVSGRWMQASRHGPQRGVVSVGCIVLYVIVWILVSNDPSVSTTSPGPYVVGGFFGLLLGFWLGMVSVAATQVITHLERGKKVQSRRRP